MIWAVSRLTLDLTTQSVCLYQGWRPVVEVPLGLVKRNGRHPSPSSAGYRNLLVNVIYCARRIFSWDTTLYYSDMGLLIRRVKLWLFVAYVVSFVCLAGSVGLLVQDALTDKGPSVWTGVAGVLQCVFVLIRYISTRHQLVSRSLLHSLASMCVLTSHRLCSGLTYWTCHTEDD